MNRFLHILPLASTLAMTALVTPASASASAATSYSSPLVRVSSMGMAQAFSGSAIAEAQSGVQTADAGAEAEPGVVVLNFDHDAYARQQALSTLRMNIPTSAGPLALELTRFEVFAPDAVLVEASAQGERTISRPDAQYWVGHVLGEPQSRVFLALSPLGSSGFVQAAQGTYSLSTIAPDVQSPLAGRTTVVNVRELAKARDQWLAEQPVRRSLIPAPWTCGGAIVPPGRELPLSQGPVSAREDRGPGGACRVIRVAIDCDNEYTANLFAGNVTSATNYTGALMAAVSSIYARDVGVSIQVTFLRLWTAPDPYNAANTGAQLSEFRTYWIANRPAAPHDLTHLLSGRGLGGGVAYLSTLCDPGFGMGVSANLNGSFPQPLADNRGGNWDPYVIAHEMGHNFSSGHTHEPFSYNPPIDGCGNAYLNPPQTQDCAAAAALNGTIMSYCHLCSGGVGNIDMTFGPRPITKISTYLTSSVPTCGVFLSTPSVNTTITASGTRCPGGTVTLSVSASPLAGESLTYRWFRGSTQLLPSTPMITLANFNTIQAATYTCVVSNGCQQVTAGPMTLTLCRADFNCSGAVSVQDIFDFLAAWFAADPRADVNSAGGVSTQDIFDFMALWFAGC